MLVDASQHVTRLQQRPLQQRAENSATRFCVGVDDADTGEFAAKFPADDGHYITDYSDSATCYGDHYDDNYQVILVTLAQCGDNLCQFVLISSSTILLVNTWKGTVVAETCSDDDDDDDDDKFPNNNNN